MKRITYFLSGALAGAADQFCNSFRLCSRRSYHPQRPASTGHGSMARFFSLKMHRAVMLLFSLTTARPMHRFVALAEAYGLTVGYDSAKNMATVVGAARTTNSTGSFSSQLDGHGKAGHPIR